MAKFLTLAQLQKEFGITMRSLKELMQREIYEPVKSIADQAKAIAAGVRRDADEGRFDGAPGRDGEPGAPGQDGAPGEPGNPGFSPTVHVAEVTGGYRVTITDESGAHDFIVYDGADGQDGVDGTDGVDGQDGEDGADGADGFSPSVAVSDITGGHRVTITDAVGDHVFDVMDGQSGGGAVSSVNGQTGEVVLDAEDVGARADTWMPTAEDVGALPDDTTIPSALSDLSGDATHRTVTDSEKATWGGKQDAISDLATIRSNAANGQTAYEMLAGLEELLAAL